MTYTNVFGGNTIYPSDVSYLSIALSVDTPLEWPLESSGTEDPAARIIDVDPSADGFSVILPNATLTGAGQTILFNNIDGVYSFYIKDYAGNTLATVTAGTQWQVYLAATTTAAGTWRVFRYGASTATVQPSALAGNGLTVTGSQLAQGLVVRTFNSSPVTVAAPSNRAEALVWIGSGAGTFNLPAAATAGNNFFFLARNSGAGDLTLDPNGSERVNGLTTLTLRPGDSATLITDGTTWYTIGFGQDAVFAFDFTIIPIPSGSSTLTLSGSQLNRIAYQFTGALTTDCTIIVPATIQQYWVTNATTGSFALKINTSTGSTPVTVNPNARGIYYCDGTNVVLADTASVSLPISLAQGGTGGTTQSSARSGIGISTFADPIVTATNGATVRTTIGATTVGSNVFTLTNPSAVTFLRFNADNSVSALSAATFRTAIGATTVGGNMFALTDPSAITFPRFNADNTVSALDATAFRTAIGAGTGSGNGTVTSVGGTGSVNGLSLSGTVTVTGNITLSGSITSVASNATINGDVIGYRNIPRSTTSGTAATVDVGKVIAVTAGITIPNSTFAAGDAVSIYNNSSSPITITQGVGLTMYQVGSATTGNRTLAQRGMATIWFNSATDCVISGGGLS